MRVEVTGMEALLAQVRRLADSEEVQKKALEAGAAETKKVLEAAAPVRVGTLKANIITSDIVDGKVMIGTKPTGDGFYGFFLEYGTSKMAARPWARPAFEQNRNRIKEIMAAELRRGLGL